MGRLIHFYSGQQAHLCTADRGEVLPELLRQHIVRDVWRQISTEDGVVWSTCTIKLD